MLFTAPKKFHAFSKAMPFLENPLQLFQHDEILIDRFLQASFIFHNLFSIIRLRNHTKHVFKSI